MADIKRAEIIEWSTCQYEERFADMLYHHLAKGFSFASFSCGAGVTSKTLQKWCKRFPAFGAAKELGEKAKLKALEDQGLKMIKGGNVVAWKFMMNQMGMHETTKVEKTVEHSVSQNTMAPIRLQRLKKLKELGTRVAVESEILDVEEVTDDSDLDLL